MRPSRYQQAIFDFAADPKGGNAVVQAVAGSGKTTTLKMVAAQTPSKIKNVCFNKSIADKASQEFPPNVESSTLHSVGRAAWARRIEPDSTKMRRIFDWLKNKGQVPRWVQPGKFCKLASLAKNEGLVPAEFTDMGLGEVRDGVSHMTGLLPDTKESWLSLFDRHNIELSDKMPADLVISTTRKMLVESIKYGSRIIDFDDMLYLPALTDGVAFPKYPWVYVDELQDVSGLQREIILRMVEYSGRFLGVGDRKQAIYGWRGADAESMDKIVKLTNSREMPLSICYRCPTSVLDVARKFVPQIEARENAPAGIVEHHENFMQRELLDGHLVICRNRAPMMKLAYTLLGYKRAVIVPGGKSLGDSISSFCNQLIGHGNDSIEKLESALDAWLDRTIAKAAKTEDEEAIMAARDKHSTLTAIIEGSNPTTVTEMLESLQSLFADKNEANAVRIGTIHSVKGLEAPHVWFLDESLIPAKFAKKEWQKQQENNLMYVGVTRAMESLHYIKSGTMR